MFRIVFDPKTSMFIVQLTRWGLFWSTCMRDVKKRDPGELDYEAVTVRVPQQFEKYSEARTWVELIGLDKAYPEQKVGAAPWEYAR